MPGHYTHPTRAAGLTLTAAIYNADHQNHIDNDVPLMMDDYSVDLTQMRAQTDPGEVGTESQPTTLAGELERLRFAIREIKGTTHWYQSPAQNLVSMIPAGTLMLFQQTAAPTGWTKQTTHNNKALRVVSGAASSAGSTPFTTVFGAGKQTAAYALTVTDMPFHNHSLNDPGHSHGGATDAQGNHNHQMTTNLSINGNGGGAAHLHGLSLDLQYVDIIIASKD
jgi:hypothetical protein